MYYTIGALKLNLITIFLALSKVSKMTKKYCHSLLHFFIVGILHINVLKIESNYSIFELFDQFVYDCG